MTGTPTEARLREAGVLEAGPAFFADPGRAPEGFLVERLWGENAAGWIAGEPKTLKTWLLLEIILGVTAGHQVLGQFDCERPGRYLYAAEEGSRRKFQRRLAGLCAGYGIPLERVQDNLDVIWRRHIDLADPAWQRDLLEIAPKYRAIGLDPFRDMHGVDEDRVHLVKPVLDYLRRLQEAGPAIQAVMHLRKANASDRKTRAGQRVAGSRHFHSFLDSALYMDPEDVEARRVQVSVEHRDEESPPPLTIELESSGLADRPRFRLCAHSELADRAEEMMERVWRTANDVGPTTKTQLATSLGMGKQAALRVVNDCLERGVLIPSEDGKQVLAAQNRSEAVPNLPEPLRTEGDEVWDFAQEQAA